MKRVCIYCGSSPGLRPEYRRAAQELADAMLAQGLSLVYGGASVGLMGEIADRVLAGGGEVIGVIPKFLVDREVSHPNLSELHVVDSMHERKALMVDLSDAFIAMPGGFGTLDELFETLTWGQLALHNKPCGLLNVCGYYNPLLQMLDAMVSERFAHEKHRELLLSDTSPQGLLKQMLQSEPTPMEKWVDRDKL